jgi:hypothetical protein
MCGHPAREIRMQIKHTKHRQRPKPTQPTNPRKTLTFHVINSFGDHRTVQNQKHPIDGLFNRHRNLLETLPE